MKAEMGLAVAIAAVLLAGRCVAGQKAVARDASLRAGPGAYYDTVQRISRGTAVATGESRNGWIAVRTAGGEGWLPLKAFEKSSAGLDYSGMLGQTDITVVSAVDIAAATKGAFASSYSDRHNVDFGRAQQLDELRVDGSRVEALRKALPDKDAGVILRRLPVLKLDADIVLRPDAESLLGRALVARIAEKGFITDAGVIDYVNSVAGLVGSKAERYDLAYKVGILDDPSINGFGLPGGYVLITKGLLELTRNESELACLLGHEMAHISRMHGLREFKKRETHRKRDDVFAELENISGGTSDSEVEEDLNKLADTAYLTIMGGRARGDELEADLFGMAYAAAAGYDPSAMLDLLARIGAAPGLEQDMFRHHPPLADRISTLRADLKQYALQWNGQQKMAERFAQNMRPPEVILPRRNPNTEG